MWSKIRDYRKLPGSYIRQVNYVTLLRLYEQFRAFRYKRCNRQELQKDVDKMKRQIKAITIDNKAKTDNHLEEVRKIFNEWMNLIYELLYPPHQDFVNIRRGMRNCLWLQSPNITRVREDEEIRMKRANYKEKF